MLNVKLYYSTFLFLNFSSQKYQVEMIITNHLKFCRLKTDTVKIR